jgi:hypothetical protein
MVIGVSMLNKSHITVFFLLLVSLQQLAWNAVPQLVDPTAETIDFIGVLSSKTETEGSIELGLHGGEEDIISAREGAFCINFVYLYTNSKYVNYYDNKNRSAVLDVQIPPPDGRFN